MYTIQLDISDVKSLKNQILKISDNVDELYKDISKTAAEIDMKVRSRKDIDLRLQAIKTDLLKEKQFLTKCAALIDESINEFAEAEKIDRLPDVNFSLNSVSSGGHDLDFMLSDLIIDDTLLASSEISGLFSKNTGITPGAEFSDHSEIAKYFETIWSEIKNS